MRIFSVIWFTALFSQFLSLCQHMLGLALRATRTGILSRQLLVSGFRSSARSLFVLSAPRLPQCHNIPYNIPLQPCVILSPKWRWVSLMSTVPQPAVVAEIARGETLADSIPNNVPAQLRLFNLCIKQGGDAGHKVIMSRWERMCEFVRFHSNSTLFADHVVSIESCFASASFR